MKCKQKIGGPGGVRLGGQGGCERRIEVICENAKKKSWGRGGVVGSGWRSLG